MTNTTGIYLLLASGFSRRFGSPKQLHPLPSGLTIIDSSIMALQTSGCDFVVVIREDDISLLTHLSKLNVKTIKVATAQSGLSSVIAEATRRLETTNIEWLGICLGDMPYIQPSTFKELPSHISKDTIVRPRYLKQLGHPVLFGCYYFNQLKKLEGDTGAKSIIKMHPKALQVIDVEDAMVLHDIDEAKDIISTS